MIDEAIARRRALHERSIALRRRADTAIERAGAVASWADAVVSRARKLCSEAWNGQLTRWYARDDGIGLRRGRRRAQAAVERRRERAASVAARAALEPRDDGEDQSRSTPRWADARVFDERRILAIPIGLSAALTVREIDTQELHGAHGPRCLVFENHQIVRRVWSYPDDWATMSDDALLALAGFRT